MKPAFLQQASTFAAVTALALVLALAPVGLPRWLAYALLVVGGAAFLPAVVGLIVRWTGVEAVRSNTGRRSNALLTVLFTVVLLVNAHSIFVVGLTHGWVDDLAMFTFGVNIVGIALFAGRALGHDPLLGGA